jgi:hypothetical protein
MKYTKTLSLYWSVALLILAGIHQAAAQGTAFTYQGSLSADAAPANGFFDFEFKLYTNATGAGTQVSSNLTQTNIGVTNGLFTTALNFGDVFTGDDTWLAVAVTTNGGTNFTTLNPFQELTPTPYAIYAPNAGIAATASSVAATNITGAIALAQLPSTVVTNDEGGVILSNVTVKGNLTLPSPATINSGGNSLLLSIGNNNFYAGPGAGILTNSGSANTGIGSQSLQSNSNGTNNTAIGYLALGGNINGSYNTATGERALALNASGNDNTADGRHAMINNTTGSANVAVGYDALAFNTNDSELVAIGYEALEKDNAAANGQTTSGYGENTAIGFQTLQLNTLGFRNTAIGFLALQSNTFGFDNTAVGDSALEANTNGSANTAMGDHTLQANTFGFYNTALGWTALYFNTEGNFNTAVGMESLYENTNGAENTANGVEALLKNTSGSLNSAFGVAALQGNTTGSNNTAIGTFALANSDTASNNTALGYEAGDNLTNGDNNIYVGNPGAASESGAIRIGTNGVQDKKTFIAGIYGTALPSGSGTPVFIDSSGHLGTAGVSSFSSYVPTIGDGTHPFTTYTADGYYTQTGNLVYFEVWLQWSDKGSATAGDNLQISLPLPVVSLRPAFSLGFTSGISFGSQLVAWALNGDSDIVLNSLSNSGGGPSAVLVGDASTSGEIQITGTYRWQ